MHLCYPGKRRALCGEGYVVLMTDLPGRTSCTDCQLLHEDGLTEEQDVRQLRELAQHCLE